METRRLGNSNMDITPIGVGAWAMGGGGWEFGWGPQHDQDSLAAIHEALDLGVNWIDTAAVYLPMVGYHIALQQPLDSDSITSL